MLKFSAMEVLGFMLLCLQLLTAPTSAETHHHTFVIEETPYTRLCETKYILTVNGQFPGPTIKARKGDSVIVRVHNNGDYNITLHWHGVDQPRNPWTDGPEYITQCPIKPGASFTYRIDFTEEEGTIWWHAHSDWDRATVHGAIIVLPKLGSTFPFPKPHREIPIILGEWWKGNVSQVLADALRTGGGPNISDAYTINGQPGDLYNCSKPELLTLCLILCTETFTALVEHGKTYLLRVINAAINNELFFGVAGHQITVVGTDASYTKPFTTSYIMITPGQTMDLLLEANQPISNYYMAARPYASNPGVGFDTTTTTAILKYKNPSKLQVFSPSLPTLPLYSDNTAATAFTAGLRSLSPADVPQTIDQRIIITIAVNTLSCTGHSCQGPNGDRLAASLNNISFSTPKIDILDAYYNHIKGVYGDNFPSRPPFEFNYTGDNLQPFITRAATEVKVLEYNTSVEVVFQDTNILGAENHPMHLHGQSFYVVGRGFGNYEEKDALAYNLIDPPYENTVGVPIGGWTAIRFRAKNPGVWFMHCHLDRHLSWGMDTVFIVKDGVNPDEMMLPPPEDMPPC